jgi:transcriptional/translational regulatory protein YebC/TACO1
VELSPNDEEKLEKIIETLDEHDDVQEIYTNAE